MRTTKPARRYQAALENAFAMRLCERRRALGLSQAQVGERLGVTKVTLRHWESGRSYPVSFAAYRAWVRALGGVLKIDLTLPAEGK